MDKFAYLAEMINFHSDVESGGLTTKVWMEDAMVQGWTDMVTASASIQTSTSSSQRARLCHPVAVHVCPMMS
ncbi:hypothetical protein E2P81_ATG03761 [Venturia nashicola]|uniref:Uncharacterized protein n=1 Tax=Venturia nashicola TaxID=86259 RepID=A0A4Z1P9W2_9PEZI|nr:hypothetical protein E6O75_ATG03846 [Venturia nashicola]TLD38086.1 hypothetical protein E2P81_ATG03761 [Venturia nashicola]